jgi:crossover junction endodeoxyribonuclease RusA
VGAAVIELPFPSSKLAGHTDGKGRWAKIAVTKQHREWARCATLAIGPCNITGTGDIRLVVTFYPPNRRGDRVNFPNRMKPYFDGIADALKVNDSRFLPSYHFAEPVKGCGKVVVVVG